MSMEAILAVRGSYISKLVEIFTYKTSSYTVYCTLISLSEQCILHINCIVCNVINVIIK